MCFSELVLEEIEVRDFTLWSCWAAPTGSVLPLLSHRREQLLPQALC